MIFLTLQSTGMHILSLIWNFQILLLSPFLMINIYAMIENAQSRSSNITFAGTRYELLRWAKMIKVFKVATGIYNEELMLHFFHLDMKAQL